MVILTLLKYLLPFFQHLWVKAILLPIYPADLLQMLLDMCLPQFLFHFHGRILFQTLHLIFLMVFHLTILVFLFLYLFLFLYRRDLHIEGVEPVISLSPYRCIFKVLGSLYEIYQGIVFS